MAFDSRKEFLKGPLPWAWIQALAKGERTSAAVPYLALWVWRMVDTTRKPTIKIPLGVLAAELDTSRQKIRRALDILEERGLAEVRRRRGGPPLVRIPEKYRGWRPPARKGKAE